MNQKMNNKKFVAFILTHGRPDRVKTYNTLRRCGYTGDIKLLVDSHDKTADEYVSRYGDEVVTFDKDKYIKKADSGDNQKKYNSVLYARNATFDVAVNLGYEYFIQLDDDYSTFGWRISAKTGYVFNNRAVKSLDSIFGYLIEFLYNSGYSGIAFAQGGDYIGGSDSSFAKSIKLKRKLMNSMIFKADCDLRFAGRMNDDVNFYIRHGSRGHLLGTTNQISLNQTPTQAQGGGLTEMYLESGTYVKSFYSILYQPSSVIIQPMGNIHRRLHHRIAWKNTVPCIISEKHKKAE
jgi:hypothetical protein